MFDFQTLFVSLHQLNQFSDIHWLYERFTGSVLFVSNVTFERREAGRTELFLQVMNSGYIKLYRSSFNDPLYLKEPFTKWQAWCDLLLLAYFAPAEFFVRGIKVKAKRGCVYMGVLELADRWQWSRGKVERFISYLETDKKISVQKSHVVNCMSIVNYEKYQQNEPTNSPTNEPTNGPTNEPTYKKNKEDKEDILFPNSGELGCNPAELLMSLKAEMEELKTRLDSSDKKSPKKEKVNPLIGLGREVFEERYKELFGDSYYWQAKDSVAMGSLTKKLMYSRAEKGLTNENEEVVSALKVFLSSICDQWILKNYSVTNINSKYNEIVAQAKAAYSKKSNGNDRTSNERSDEAARALASLASRES